MRRNVALSFEFFPPKTNEARDALIEQASILATFHPDFFSVTYGAAGSTREGTLKTAALLKEVTRVNVAPHLACIGSAQDEMITAIKKYRRMGFAQLVALRGDMPSGLSKVGDFTFASQLVNLIRRETENHFHISVAAYPEIHPQAQSVKDDILNLKRKYEAGANRAITQFFFNPDAYFRYLDETVKQHILLPIVPGVMPIVHFAKLARFSSLCGAEIPRWMYKRLESYGDDAASIREFGIEAITRLAERLLQGGAPGLHFYTLNRSDIVCQILQQLTVWRSDKPSHRNRDKVLELT